MIYKFPSWLRLLACAAISFSGISLSEAAPYPKEGLSIEWKQPDGTVVPLRVYGDEFYGRTTTEDGYTVIFSDADQTYYYAARGLDGQTLAPTTTAAGKPAPAGVIKQLKENPAKVADQRAANIAKFTPDREREWAAKAANPEAAPVTGSQVGLTILVQFPDDSNTPASDAINFPVTRTKMERYCNESGYVDDGNTGSIKDYFYDQSNGLMTHTQSVSTIVTLPKARNYYNYSDYPSNTVLRDSGDAGRQLVADAIAKLKTDGYDFSTLSTDSSGRVIATSLLFAGNTSGVWSYGLWPHAWSLASPLSVGSKSIYRYQCTNVPNSAPVIGTMCHELGHLLLGYPDLYDTNSANGNSEGVGEHCLMGSANYLNGGRTPAPIDIYLKSVSGWANITDIAPDETLNVDLPSTGNVGYRIRKPGSITEYFVVENRGTGDKWAAYCKDKGLAIWHIDEAVSSNNNQQMLPNLHYKVSIEQADGRFDLEGYVNRGDSGDFFDKNTDSFDDYSNPNAQWWSGADSGLAIKATSLPGASMNVLFGPQGGLTTLGVSPGVVFLPATSGSQSVTVNSSATWSWSGQPSWVTTSEAVTQTGKQTFDYTFSRNRGSSSRMAVLTFTTGTVTRTHTIIQEGTDADDHGNQPVLATLVPQDSTTSGNIERAGDIDVFRIDVNGPGNLTITSTGASVMNGELLDVNGTSLASSHHAGGGNNFSFVRTITGPVTFYVRATNYNGTTGAYSLVSDFQESTSLSITPAVQTIPMGGGSSVFNVLSKSTNWTWSKDSAATWVTTTEPSPQSLNQEFSYTVAPNTGLPRTAVITVTSSAGIVTHTIKQAGLALPDLMDPAERTKINPDYLLSKGWFKLEADVRNASTSPCGSFVVTFYMSVNENITTSDTKIGQITVPGLAAGETRPIDLELILPTFSSTRLWFGWFYDANNQVAEEDESNNATALLEPVLRGDPYLTISASTRTMEGMAATSSLSVVSENAWTWTSNAAWLTSTSASARMGDGEFAYTVTENPNTSNRSGTITFSSGTISRTFAVTQGPKPIPLVFTAFQRSGNNVNISFASETGKTYKVMSSTSLQTGSWTLVPGHSGISGTGNTISRTLTGMAVPPTEGKRFFRVERE